MTSEEPKDSKLHFTIVHCTSEDEAFPVSQLVRHTTSTRGWHSTKLCEYPQEIIIRFDGEVRISMIKILSHETKISSRIDLAVCRPDRDHQQARAFPPLHHATFHRLGYLTFTNNEESGFESRELKSAQINTRAIYLKISLRRCHPNISNVFNQVGIVALGIYGETLAEFEPPVDDQDSVYGDHLPGSIKESNHNINNNHLQQEVPLSSLAVVNNHNHNHHEASSGRLVGGGKMDSRVAAKIDDLSHQKLKAVDSDDFDEAKRLKILIDRLRDAGLQLADLEERKRRAVDSEDYDVAKALKLQIDEAKKNVDYELDHCENSKPASRQQQQIQQQNQNNQNHSSPSHHQQQHQSSPHHQDNSPPAPSNPHQQTVKPSAVVVNNNNNNNSFDEQPVGGGGHQNNKKGAVPFDEQPVGSGKKGIPFDEQPVGGGNRGIPFDEQPVGASNKNTTTATATTQPVAVVSKADQHELNKQQHAEDNNNNNEESPHGLNQEFKATEYDEKPAVSHGLASRVDQLSNDTGGIVVKKPVNNVNSSSANSNVEVPDSDWEKAIRAMIQSELASEVHEPDALPTPNLPAELSNHVTQFGRYATACLISKKFQHREATIRVLGSENGVSLLQSKGGKQPTQVVSDLIAYFAEKGRGVDDGISQVFFGVCDVLKTVITGGINCRGDGVTAYDVSQGVTNLIPGLLLKAGDSNQRVREHASATLMLIAMSPIGPEKIAASLLHDPQAESKKPLNFRVQSARLNLATVMVNKIGLSTKAKPTGLTPEGLTKQLCIPQLTHSNSEVREGAVHLIVMLYGLVKPTSKMDQLLIDVAAPQRALIDEQLESVKNDPDVSSSSSPARNNNNEDNDEELKSSSISVSGPGGQRAFQAAREAAREETAASVPPKPSGKKAPAAKPGTKNPPSHPTTPRSGAKTKTPAPPQSPGSKAGKHSAAVKTPASSPKKVPAAPPRASPAKTPGKKTAPSAAPGGKKKTVPAAKQAPPPPPPQHQQHDDDDDDDDEEDPHTCQFCSRHDERYDETSLDRHYLRSCPLLCACPLCGQITEIAQLQEHLTTECVKSNLVKACPNCHEAVRASDLDSHIAASSCIKYNPSMYNVCPLCHEKIPPGEEGWKKHFAKAPGCERNPRPWDGGDIEEDFKE